MKLTCIKPQIYYLLFDNQYAVTSTMMRLEEFYESPYKNIKNKFFTLEQFMDTYAKHMGNFTYTSDWTGFNVQSEVIKKFIYYFKDDLLEKEKPLINLLQTIKDEKYYLIATYKGCQDNVLDHELAHAYYCLDLDYKHSMCQLINKFKHKLQMQNSLLKMGYCRAVLNDEIQAYLATIKKHEIVKKHYDTKEFKKVFKDKNAHS